MIQADRCRAFAQPAVITKRITSRAISWQGEALPRVPAGSQKIKEKVQAYQGQVRDHKN